MKDKDSSKNYNSRIYIIVAIFIFVALFLIFRLYFLQIAKGEYYRQEAEAQNSGVSPDYFDRGNIFFNTKDGKKI
jgi:cell division protein FtsI/penicillin-binding protein 2